MNNGNAQFQNDFQSMGAELLPLPLYQLPITNYQMASSKYYALWTAGLF
jgi:hypothetical protein